MEEGSTRLRPNRQFESPVLVPRTAYYTLTRLLLSPQATRYTAPCLKHLLPGVWCMLPHASVSNVRKNFKPAWLVSGYVETEGCAASDIESWPTSL